MSSIKDTAFWTLVEAGVVTYLAPNTPLSVGDMRLWGFPWSSEITPLDDPHHLALDIAVIHKYVWVPGKGHAHAHPEDRLRILRRSLRGYDIAVVGDNHISFDSVSDEMVSISNCGAFISRKRDEISHKPSVVLIHANGDVSRKYLDASQDLWEDKEEEEAPSYNFSDFACDLRGIEAGKVDFASSLRQACEKEARGVRDCVTRALEEIP